MSIDDTLIDPDNLRTDVGYVLSKLHPERIHNSINTWREFSSEKTFPKQPEFLFTCDTELSPPRDGRSWRDRGYASLKGLEPLLDLLDSFDLKGVFFVEGKIAEEMPERVEEIHAREHEVGCHGYAHESYGGTLKVSTSETPPILTPEERRERLRRATRILAEVSECPTSFRAPFLNVDGDTIRILEELDYDADSSINNTIYGIQGPYHPSYDRVHRAGDVDIIEDPIAVAPSWLAGSPFPSFLPVTDLVYGGRIEVAARFTRFWYGATGGEPVNLITHVQDFREERNITRMGRYLELIT